MDHFEPNIVPRMSGASAWMDRKRLVLVVRSVVVATAAYLALGAGNPASTSTFLAVAAFALSHAVLIAVPRQRFEDPRFGPMLLLGDSVLILLCLSWTQGVSQDLVVVYFFTVFLISIGETLGQVAIASALVTGMYGYWLWLDGGQTLSPAVWVRLPFFFLIGVFYASLTEQLKEERRRRMTAEFESRQLRLLLDLAGAFSETEVTEEFVRGMGRFVEGACDGVRCRVIDAEVESDPDNGLVAFPLRSRGEAFGSLLVDTSARGPLTDRELWICQIVAHTAAGAVYSAGQSTEAETAARAKDEFLATVSHEFRTPLHAILGYLEILDSATEGADPMVADSIERMRVNGVRLKNLLEELLTFAELRAGYGRVVAEPISLTGMFEELVRQARDEIADKPVTVSWQVDADADSMTSDRRKMTQALGGLLSNAAKFTEKGRINVMARRLNDNTVEISVSDTGIGIASSDLALAFDDFRQVDGSFTRRYGGLGVGLPLVRELMALLGGRMEVDSQIGNGTTVRLLMPRAVTGKIQIERKKDQRVAEVEVEAREPLRSVG